MFRPVLLASAWSLFVMLPVGWWLIVKSNRLKSGCVDYPDDHLVTTTPQPFLVLVVLACLVIEVLAIWYEWPLFFFASLWGIVVLEGYWTLEELKALFDNNFDRFKLAKIGFLVWIAIAGVPVLLSFFE